MTKAKQKIRKKIVQLTHMAFEMVELIRTASGRRSYSSVHTKMWTRFCGAFASGFIL
jgi:hypothetical protein